jgi:hypothetical protein
MINDIVSRKDWNKMKWFHILDGKWLVSHAGLHKCYLPEKIAKLHKDRPKFFSELESYLTSECHKAFRQESWVSHAGHSRGGLQRVGGLIWCDFEREFYPVQGLNQIVGHTPQGLGFAKWCVRNEKDQVTYHPAPQWSPKPKDLDNVNQSYNINLDVWKNTNWATWDGKQLRLFNYRDDL